MANALLEKILCGHVYEKRYLDGKFIQVCSFVRPKDACAPFFLHNIAALTERQSIQFSMDGRGRALDNIFVERHWRNVKHKDIYLKGYASPKEL